MALELLAGAAGFEPATGGFGDRCSTGLSYAPAQSDNGILDPEVAARNHVAKIVRVQDSL